QDPIVRQMAKMLSDAPTIQLYYDQALPPALAQVHLDTAQQLFGLSITPEEAARKMQEAATKTAPSVPVEPVSGSATKTAPSTPVEPLNGSSLRSLAQARGLAVGAAVAIGPLRQDAQYAATLKREFNMVTPEDVLKMATVHPGRDTYNFRDPDEIVS